MKKVAILLYKHFCISIIFALSIILVSCKKSWLDGKPNKNLVIPKNVSDYQALLDNTRDYFNIKQASIQEISSDDIYILYDRWKSLFNAQERNAYIWASDIYEDESIGFDWNNGYTQIFTANVVLDGIEDVTSKANSEEAYNNVKGSALFFRAFALFNLLQLYAKPYDQATAKNELGLPIRLNSDIHEASKRATLQETYDQIVSDLLHAENLLPVEPLYKTRPSKCAVYALLARIYLSMEEYDFALKYADSSLAINGNLLNYNTLNSSSSYPIPRFNDEVIFHSVLNNYSALIPNRYFVDSLLFEQYDAEDLRKTLFFKNGSTVFRGSYNGSYVLFGGLATDEMYLIRSECYARGGAIELAMDDLNTLVKSRWSSSGSYSDYTASNSDEALAEILAERRKELLLRGLRWSDLRRLNRDNRFQTTITRELNGESYSLSPNDVRYVYTIPESEIRLSGIQQNSR